jgi:hypothetical protein
MLNPFVGAKDKMEMQKYRGFQIRVCGLLVYKGK